MYIDPSLSTPLLEPLFCLQALPNYPIPYAAADLGTLHINPISEMSRLPTIGLGYLNVTSSSSSHNQGVEHQYLSL